MKKLNFSKLMLALNKGLFLTDRDTVQTLERYEERLRGQNEVLRKINADLQAKINAAKKI